MHVLRLGGYLEKNGRFLNLAFLILLLRKDPPDDPATSCGKYLQEGYQKKLIAIGNQHPDLSTIDHTLPQ